MPIYIVRWPSFSVSLLRARDEAELLDMLDDVDDPAACRWEVYRGPLWFDLDLPVQVRPPAKGCVSTSASEIEFDGMEELLEEGVLQYDASPGGGDAGYEMREAVTRWAFPSLYALLSDAAQESPPTPALRTALQRDVVHHLKYAWRAAQAEKRTDVEGLLLQQLGLTKAPPWLKKILESKKPEE